MDVYEVTDGARSVLTNEEWWQADTEGWYISSLRGVIRKNPPGGWPQVFKSNEEAIEFVRLRAEQGSAMHTRAISKHVTMRLVNGRHD